MMRGTRGILTLAVVAAVLCADRTLTMAAEVRPQVVQTARQVARHLGERFRSRTPAARYMGSLRMPIHQSLRIDRAEAANRPSATGCTLVQLPMPPPLA